MGVIVTIALIIFVPVCVILTLIILLQDSKGEGLSSSAFGGSEMQSILGGHGAATFLSKLTTWVAVGFMVISLFLMRFYGETGTTDLTPIDNEPEQTQEATGPDTADQIDKSTTDDVDPKGSIKTTQDPNEDASEETPTDDPKGTE